MVRRRIAALAAVVGFLLLVHSAAWAQERSLAINDVNDDDYPFVKVTVTVPETFGDVRLPKEAFAVSENGETRPRPTQGNAPAEDRVAPRAVLAIDVSGSMRTTIDRARAAAETFVTSLPRGSEVAVVTFGDEVDVPLDFTDDLTMVQQVIQAVDVDPAAETALYDGVRQAAELLPTSDGVTSSIVLLSDGEDTISEGSERAAVEAVERSDATVWAVGLESGDFNPDALEVLAGDDGRVLGADAEQLEGIYRGLASDLTRRYVLIYESTASGDTEIGVTVAFREVQAQGIERTELSGEPAASGPAPVAPPDVFTVALPPLATTPAFVTGLTALAVGSLLIWLMVLTPRPTQTRERLLSGTRQPTRPRLSQLAERATDIADRSLRNRKLGHRIDRELERAGLDLRPGEVLLIVVSMMVVMFAIGVVAGSPLLGILLATAPPLGGQLVLSIRRDRRQGRFAEQLPDILQLLTGSLRAGYGLVQGIDAIARDIDEPARSEFRRILIEHRLGRDLNDAMHSCAERMDNADFSWVVQAIGIHRDIGGDLARVLDNIVSTIRDRADIQRDVRSLSAEGRLSANVLTGLPILVLISLQFMNPGYLTELFTSPMGWLMLATATISLLIGALLIRRMVRIRY